MDLKGKIIAVLPEKSGKTAKGDWKSQQYVLETDEKYPKKLLFEVFGESKIKEYGIEEGEVLTISYDPEAHEKDGRWFCSNRAWGVTRD